MASLEARFAIQDLNTDFCYHLDHGNLDELVDLFTQDAFYAHGNRITEGRVAIRELFDRRAAAGDRTARHMYSGLRISWVSETRATGVSVCMTFAADSLPPIVPAIPYLVADFIDEYDYCDDGRWRISRRQINRIFLDSSNSGPVGQSPQEPR